MARTTRNSKQTSSTPVMDDNEEDSDLETDRIRTRSNEKKKKSGKPKASPKKSQNEKPKEDESSDHSDDALDVEHPDEDDTVNVHKPKTKDREPETITSSSVFAVLGILSVIVLLLVSYIIQTATTESNIDIQSGISEIFEDFKNQPNKSKRVLQTRAMSYLNDGSSPQPLVIMVAASDVERYAADCFATRLAKLMDSQPLVINGTSYFNIQSEKAKLEIDEKLQETFQENIFPTVAIILDLEMLSFDTSMLFYKYCDHDNPRYRKAAIIFTVLLPQDYYAMSISGDDVANEGMVESYLTKHSVWTHDDKFDMDKLGALLSRISDTVIVLKSENSESLKNFCA